MIVFIFGQIPIKEGDTVFYDQLLEACDAAFISCKIFVELHNSLVQVNKKYEDVPTFNSRDDLEFDRPDVLITLGGDGTILRAITFIGDLETPIMGINLGRLGFLANIEKKYIARAIQAIHDKKYSIDSRSMLAVSSNLPLFKTFPYAVNDFTINKRDTSSMITIHTYIDDILLNSYWADGIIISTPTGSTGYSLSCGGPIIFPEAQNFVITPVAPHNLTVRPVVISDKTLISIKVEGRTKNFMSTLDSRYETITSEHKIEVKKAPFKANFVKLKGHSFMKTINEKLLWGLDKRNY